MVVQSAHHATVTAGPLTLNANAEAELSFFPAVSGGCAADPARALLARLEWHDVVDQLAAAIAQWWWRPRPVRKLLLFIALAIVLPALAFAGILIVVSAAQQHARIEQRLSQAAGRIANDVDRELERMLTLLEVLSFTPSLQMRDYAAFYDVAKQAMQRLPATIIVLDPVSMQMLVNTGLPYGTPLIKTADPESAQVAVASGGVVVSNLFFGTMQKTWTLNILKPVPASNGTAVILVLAIEARHLLSIMDTQQIEADWITGVSDRNGLIIARSSRHTDFVGKPLPDAILRASRDTTISAPGQAFVTTSIEGVLQLRAVAQSRVSGWLVSANVPMAIVNAGIRQNQMALVIGGLALLAAALALASQIARRIIQPMGELATSAAALRDYQAPQLIQSPVQETNEVAAVLRSASLTLSSQLEQLNESERRIELAQRTVKLAHIEMDLVTGRFVASGPFAEVFGFSMPPGMDITSAMERMCAVIHPEDRARFRAGHHAAIAKAGAFSNDFRIIRGDGQVRWIAVHGEAIADGSGQPVRIICTNQDITQHKDQEQHVRFLLREVCHRSKNMLAIIQAMARQTARNSRNFADFEERFGQRLQGMAVSQELLVSQDWQGADLASLVRVQLRPFADEQSGKVHLVGPSLSLSPAAAQSIGLALHELATNASKHGAWSQPGGEVHVTWRTGVSDATTRFHMSWCETGGPVVRPPGPKGFGHTVFDRMISQALNAQVDVRFTPDGLSWHFETELAHLICE